MAFARNLEARPIRRVEGGDTHAAEPSQPAGVMLGRQQRPPIPVPDALIRVYLPRLGPAASLVWITLRWWITQGLSATDLDKQLATHTGLTLDSVDDALAILQQAGLLEMDGEQYILHETDASAPAGPQPPSGQIDRPAVDAVTSGPREKPGLPPAGQMPPLGDQPTDDDLPMGSDEAPLIDSDEMQAVVSMYHSKIGMMGPAQFEKLRFWVDEQGMRGEVIALAIAETVRSAKRPSIAYLEGILRNWFNAGVRAMEDLLGHPELCSILAEQQTGAVTPREGAEGRPNAAAYQRVQSDAIQRWKDLYPDEYES